MSRFDVLDAIYYPAPNFNAPNPRRILSSTLGRAGYAEMTAAIGDRRSRGRSRPDFIVSSGGGSYVRVTLRLPSPLRITRGTTFSSAACSRWALSNRDTILRAARKLGHVTRLKCGQARACRTIGARALCLSNACFEFAKLGFREAGPWCALFSRGSRHNLHLRGAHLPGSRNSHPR